MKIKSDRVWDIKTLEDLDSDCLIIQEIHDSADPNGEPPQVLIPIESVSKLIKALQNYNKKRGTND